MKQLGKGIDARDEGGASMSRPRGTLRLGRRSGLLIASAIGLAVLVATVWGAALRSALLVGRVEQAISDATGQDFDVRRLSVGLDGLALHDVRLTSLGSEIELQADVVRVHFDLDELLETHGRELEADFEGLSLERLGDGGRLVVLEAGSGSAVRRADGRLESRGRAELHQGGTVRWELSTSGGTRDLRGRLKLEGASLASAEGWIPEGIPLSEAVAHGDLALEPGSEAGTVQIAGHLTLQHLRLESERIADRPIQLPDLDFEGRFDLSLSSRRAVFSESSLDLGDLSVRFEGVVANIEGWQVSGDAVLPESECDDVVGAVPTGLLGPYEGFRLAGMLSGEMSVVLDTNAPDATELEIAVDDGCTFLEAPREAQLSRFTEPFRHAAKDAKGNDYELILGPGTSAWTRLDEISPFLQQAVMAHEDATFPTHDGFATFAIDDALEANLRAGGIVRGASTISMQLAKNLFLERDRTVARKAREVLLTWWLEHRWTKRAILELYLNVVELGPEIYGVRHAAAHYFHQSPAKLTPAQSVFLATLLPDPVARHEQLENGTLFESTEREIRFLLRHMAERGQIGERALEFGLWELERRDFFRPTLAESLLGPRPPNPEEEVGPDLEPSADSRGTDTATPR